MRIFLFLFIILWLTKPTLASELTATELYQYCGEVNKGSIGNEFDKELAQQCKGYMAAFFDSMIVVEKLTGEKAFCIPRALPKTQNTMILGTWVTKNRAIASKTTAAVALYAAFKNAFPC